MRAMEPYEINDMGAVNLIIAVYKQPAREYVRVLRKLEAAKPGDNTYTLEMRAAELRRYFSPDPYGLFSWDGDMLCDEIRKIATGVERKWMKGELNRWTRRD